MKPEIPTEDFEQAIYCDLCHKEMNAAIKPIKARIYLGQNTIQTLELCERCTEEKLDIPKERIEFLRVLQKFRSFNRVKWEEDWTKEATEVFVKYLDMKKIEVRDYGISLFTHWDKGLGKDIGLLDLIEKYNIEYYKPVGTK